MFNVQFSSGTNPKHTNKLALENKLSIVSFIECENKLKIRELK